MNKCILYDSSREVFFGLQQSLADGMITEYCFWETEQYNAYVFSNPMHCVEVLARHYQDIENPEVGTWYIVSWDNGADFGDAFLFSEEMEEYYAVG